MGRVRDPNREQAFLIYKQNNGFIDLVEIASQLNLPAGTIRGWKSKDSWDDKINGTLQKNTERSKKKENATKQIADEVKQVMDNPELNDKQRLFCLNYIKCFNATKAYQKTYECSYETAMVEGCNSLMKPKIRDQIAALKQGKLNQAFLEPGDIFQKYMDIAFADYKDYATFGVKEVTFSDNEGREATVDMSYVDLTESWMVDGSLITEISKNKDGIKLKLADRMKALQWLTDHMDMATEKQRLEMAKIKIEVSQLSVGTDGNTGIKDFLKAIKPSPEDIKNLFADEEEVSDNAEASEKE
ncbi:MAG: Terminase small subunit [Herbinix sp.]|jgi:phage terminase small subunit|nr:Terminase small subunit [Herbinix sp.]